MSFIIFGTVAFVCTGPLADISNKILGHYLAFPRWFREETNGTKEDSAEGLF